MHGVYNMQINETSNLTMSHTLELQLELRGLGRKIMKFQLGTIYIIILKIILTTEVTTMDPYLEPASMANARNTESIRHIDVGKFRQF